MNRTKSGELIHVWQTVLAVRRHDGSLEGYLGMARDMSGHVELRNRLSRENAELTRLNGFKSQLLSIAAHDIRSPLQGVVGYADLIEVSAGDVAPDKLLDYAGKIKSVALRMGLLVENLLDLQKAEQGQMRFEPKRVRLGSLLRSAAELHSIHAGRSRVILEVRHSGPIHPVYADVQKLDQALSNLMGNAVKFSPEGGTVPVEMRTSENGVCRFTIEDEGRGVPSDMLEKIFEPDFRAGQGAKSVPGVGWGLAIVRLISELDKGKVWAENRKHGGLRVVLEIPCNYDEFEHVPGAALVHGGDLKSAARLEEVLSDAGIPTFVTSDFSDAKTTAMQEVPNILIGPEEREQELLSLTILHPFNKTALNPAVAVYNTSTLKQGEVWAADKRSWSPELRFVCGSHLLRQSLAALFPALVPHPPTTHPE